MKIIKYFTNIIFLISSISISYSSETSELWKELREKYAVFEIEKEEGEDPLTKKERDNKINEGFSQIEKILFRPELNITLPNPLKEFYQEARDLSFSLNLLTPMEGADSPLYNGIREGHEQGIPLNWFVFSKLTGSEYFCINYNSEIARFLTVPEVKQHDTYSNILEWAKKEFLED